MNSFNAGQLEAVRHAFYLSGYGGQLRLLPDQLDGALVFIVDQEVFSGDAHSLEIVLHQLLDSNVIVTGDVGAPSVMFE